MSTSTFSKTNDAPFLYLESHLKDPEAAPGKGPLSAKYAFVGPAPSLSRPSSSKNEPFGASTYKMMMRILAGTGEASVYATNLVKTPQPFKKLKVKIVRQAYPDLVKELNLVQPERILAMGTDVAKALCPGFDSLRDDHGTLFRNSEIGNAIVVPTFHFSLVAKDASKKPLFLRDMERFFTLPAPEYPEYIVSDRVPKQLPKRAQVFLDIETTGVDSMKDQITKVGYTWDDHHYVYIVEQPSREQLAYLHEEFFKREVTIVGHNLQFDLLTLTVRSDRFWDFAIEDTMMMAHEIGEEVLSLKHLTTTYTDRPGSRGMGGFEDNGYLAEDVLSTREVYRYFDDALGQPYIRGLFNRLVPIAVGETYNGVYIDREKLRDITPAYEKMKSEATRSMDALYSSANGTINWASPAQVVSFLISRKVKLTEKTEAGAFSVKESVLQSLAPKYPEVLKLLELREAEKFLEFLHDYEQRTTDEHPFLHPKMKLWGAATGRTSCVEPNLQNVPRVGPAKLVFISRWVDGLIGLLDLSQAELRGAGLLSGDEKFVDMLLQEDPHRHIASIVYRLPPEQITSTQRKKSKGITFGLLYGGSPKGLAERVGVPVAEVELVLKVMFEAFPGLMKYIKETKRRSVRDLEIYTPYGKRRSFADLILTEGPSGVMRKGINTPIQGCASEVSLTIMMYLAEEMRARELYARPLFGVHDSNLLDTPREEITQVAQIAREAFLFLNETPLAEYPMWKKLPFTGELILGKSWAHVESTNENYDKENNLTFMCSSHGVQ